MTYFEWLVYLIAPDYHQRENYIELLYTLYSVEFYWVLKRDRHRAEDGLELRNLYEQEIGQDPDIFGPCTCLEMMVALAIRCENELMRDPDLGDQTGRWFWIMIANLGLDKFDDECFNEDEIRYILEKFMNREYGKNGEFCMFPCQKSVSVLKKSEIAYQINYFINENFY